MSERRELMSERRELMSERRELMSKKGEKTTIDAEGNIINKSANKEQSIADALLFKFRQFKLIIDHREKAIFPFLYYFQIPHEKQQITVGDYALIYNNNGTDKIIASFERKTYEDLASSIKDGRYHNKDKMLNLRNQTNCKLFYIIEGQAFPAKKRYFGNIPYVALEASLDHLTYRDGIHILYTENLEHTAERLNRMILSICNLYMKNYNLEENITGGFEIIKSGDAEKLTDSDNELLTYILSNINELLNNVVIKLQKLNDNILNGVIENKNAENALNQDNQIDYLFQKNAKSEKDIAAEILSQIQGITAQTAHEILAKYSPLDILKRNYNNADLEKLSHMNGRKLSKQAINHLKNINGRTEIKMLATITGISEASAKYLLKYYKLVALLAKSEDELAQHLISTEKTLGLARSKLLKKCFEFKITQK